MHSIGLGCVNEYIEFYSAVGDEVTTVRYDDDESGCDLVSVTVCYSDCLCIVHDADAKGGYARYRLSLS